MDKQIAKVLIMDEARNCLLLWRKDHPIYSDDPDLPGGTIQMGQSPASQVAKEVLADTGVFISVEDEDIVYEGTGYSSDDTTYYLFVSHMGERQEIKLSWQHSSYEWLTIEEVLAAAKNAKDPYMHMVYDVLSVTYGTA